MPFKFENLRVWQASLEFGEKINSIADQFPKKELFNLSSQIRRAADSIGLNIVEGSTGQTNGEQKRFLIFANRSALEVVACLIKARRRNYIDDSTFADLYGEAESLIRMIQTFIKKLNG
jgi:four helix bundle protein